LVEAPKPELPKPVPVAPPPLVEAPKPELPKPVPVAPPPLVEAPKPELPKPVPVAPPPRVEAPKPDLPKPVPVAPPPRVEAPKPDLPKPVPVAPLPLAEPPKPEETVLRHDREFAAALALFRQSNLSAAVQALQTFVATWPDDPAAPEALYHLGEARMALGDPGQARDSFQRLAERYPAAAQAAPGLVMLGIAENRLGRRDAACAAFDRLRGAALPTWAAQRLAAEREAAGCS
jgi:TolA-binding protein